MYKPTVKFEDVQYVTASEYFSGNAYSVDIFNAKYTFGEGADMETPAEVFWRVAVHLTKEEPEDMQEAFAQAWFSLMWEGWFRPGGSIISGMGSNKKISTMNCTTVPIPEDTLDAIGKADTDIMKMAARRQGVGFDLSNLRPANSKVNNSALVSSGVTNWLKKYDNIAKHVGQKGRLPALLGSLIITHPDTEDFITCKDELDAINNVNISIQITNDFMEAVKNDNDWTMSFTVESSGEVISKTVKARDLFRKISKQAKETAEPGIQYRNLLQEGLMYYALYLETGDKRYLPHSSNACSEKFMAPYSVCNLSSINMEMFSSDPKIYRKQLEDIVPLLTRLADNVTQYELDKQLSPVPEQRWIVEQLREIGLGVTNVHGWFLNSDIAYDSDEAIKTLENFVKHYAICVFKASMALGKEKGNAPAFDAIKDKSLLMKTTYFKNIVDEFFDGDYKKVKYMRNMAHMSVAPTGSLSSIFPKPCISSGIEPVIGMYYWRRTRAVEKGTYTHYFVIPERLKEYIQDKMEPGSADYLAIDAFDGSVLDEDGKFGLAMLEIVNKYVPKGFFKPAHEIDSMQKVKLMGAVYKWIDASMSCTYNLPSTATVEDVENIYMSAYDYGVRAVSVYVDGSRQGILIFEDPVTNKAKFDKIPAKPLCGPDNRPSSIVQMCAPKRPSTLECNIHHCSVRGIPWLVILGLMDGHPYEIFAGEVEEGLYVPKTCKTGHITKQGGGKYSLTIKIRNSEVEYKDIAHALMNSNQRAITRLLSLSLRHGAPLEFIQQQLKKANGDITDFSAVVARVIGTYIKQYRYDKSAGLCPECGKDSLMRMEGCLKCMEDECTYSRCD